MKIILVEDDSFLADIYSKLLIQEGYEVTVAAHGEEALNLFEKDRPDLMLLDLALPRGDGFQILETLKGEGKIERCPIIVLSNLGQKEDIERCRLLGVSDYAVKAHVLPEELVRLVKKYDRSKTT